jgi:6-pyruvoyltetrahydropterin/6-carboxytetrahydropterin synthase
MIIRVTKEFRFEMAHALQGHDGACRNIHGHSYLLSVTLKGEPVNEVLSPKDGMVMDFYDLKKIVTAAVILPFDHALVLRKDALSLIPADPGQQKLILTDFQPTCENLVLYFAGKLLDRLPAGVRLHRLLLRETTTSYAEWYAEDNVTIQ